FQSSTGNVAVTGVIDVDMKLAVFFLLFNTAAAVKICSFNVQHFGDSKASNSKVMKILVKILSRCDVALIQEVRDATETVVSKLMLELNRFDKTHTYEHIKSKQLGRTNYMEKYVFVYRTDKVWVTDSYQYEDKQKGDEDAFSREPFIVRFHSDKTIVLSDFVLIPQHTAPKNAVKEIDELYDVFMNVKCKWKTEDIMFLGDFNADCRYVPKKSWTTIRLFTEPGFYWLINDDVDTTVRESTSCAYDRIVVHGDKFFKAIVPNSAKAFNFQRSFRLSEDEVGALHGKAT
uniref:Deoxyribonuclease n=1 Tax=Latimeria chalumnae TaxID=7897 RepID=H3B887_LATCH